MALLGGAYIVRLFWFVTKKKRSRVRAIVLNKERDSVLLVKNISYRYFHLPGGAIEDNESPESALHREIQEELGIEITIVKKFLSVPYEKTLGTVEIFVCQTDSETFSQQWELSDVKWFKLEFLPEMKNNTSEVMNSFKTNTQPTIKAWNIDD